MKNLTKKETKKLGKVIPVEVLEALENINVDMKYISDMRDVPIKEYMPGFEPEGYSALKVAKMYFSTIERKDGTHLYNHRFMLNADYYDNNSIHELLEDAGVDKSGYYYWNKYCDILAPYSDIGNRVIDMIMDEGASIEEVADFIERNMKVAHWTIS